MEKDAGIKINLVKNRGESFVDRFIGWSLNIGRILVILTESVALIAFLYRFSLDQTLVGLHARINQDQAILALLKNNETNYRNIQDRLSLAKKITTQATQETATFKTMISYIPQGVNVTNITFTSDNIRFDLVASTISPISELVDKLKSYKPVASVSIDKIDNKTATETLSVSMTVALKQNTALSL